MLSSTPAPRGPNVRLEVQQDSGRRTWAFYAQPESPTADEEAGGLSLLELLQLLRRGRWHMLIGALVLATLGAVYLQLTAPIYSVGAQVLVERQTVLANQGERMSSATLFLATQAEIISSPLVIGTALAALPRVPKASIGEDLNGGIGAVAKLVSATPVKGTNVLSLNYLGPSPAEGQSILEAIIESYRQFTRGLDSVDQSKDLQVLAAHEAELSQELEKRIAERSKMQADNAAAGVGPNGGSMHESLLDRLSIELASARAERIKLENEKFALDEHGHLGADRQRSASRQKLVEELWRVEVKLVELRALYGEGHPGMSAASQEAAALRSEVEKLKTRERAALEGEVQAARSTEARLGQEHAREVKLAIGIQLRRFEQQKLEDEIHQLSENHQFALADLRKAELTQQSLAVGRSGVAIHVLEPAAAPELPLWPQPVLVLVPCVGIGALLGLAVAWLTGLPRATWGTELTHRSVSPLVATPSMESHMASATLQAGLGAEQLGSGE